MGEIKGRSGSSAGAATASRTPAAAGPQAATGETSTYNVRWFGYSRLHQLASDTLKTAAASVGCGYDLNGNLTSKAAAGFGGASPSTYTYGQANRPASWNNGTTTVGYGYDRAGNRTQAGAQAFACGERGQLQSDGRSSYAYRPRGTTALVAGPPGTQMYAWEEYGQAVSQAGQSYGY